MTSSSTNSGSSSITVTFDVTRDVDLAAVDVQNRVSTALGRLPGDVRTNGVTVQKGRPGSSWPPASTPRRASTTRCSSATTSTSTSRTRSSGSQASATSRSSASAATRCGCGWIRASSRAAALTAARRRQCAARAERAGRRRRDRPVARTRADQKYQISVRAAGRLHELSEFQNIIVKAGAGGTLVRLRDVGHVELGAEAYSFAAPVPGGRRGRLRRHAAALRQRARRRARRSGRSSTGLRLHSRPASSTRSPSTRRRSSPSRSARC